MKNEGWIYIVESKLNNKKIKVGITEKQTPERRLKNYDQYGGIKIILSCKYNNIRSIEESLHFYLGDFFDTNVGGKEWFDLSKKRGQELLYRIFPMLLLSAIDVYKDTFFDYSNEFWEKFDNWLKEHSNDNCKKYNSFLKNKNYTDYREFVLSNSGCEKINKQKKEKQELKNQPTLQNKVCKYEIQHDKQKTINWNLFFNDNQQLLNKKVYVDRNKNNIGVIARLSNGKFGVFFKNKDMSFMDFCKFNGYTNCCGYTVIYFLDTNKTIKQTYEELKFK